MLDEKKNICYRCRNPDHFRRNCCQLIHQEMKVIIPRKAIRKVDPRPNKLPRLTLPFFFMTGDKKAIMVGLLTVGDKQAKRRRKNKGRPGRWINDYFCRLGEGEVNCFYDKGGLLHPQPGQCFAICVEANPRRIECQI